MDVKRYSVEDDMCSDLDIIQLCKDKDVATQFYSALCNMKWVRIDALTEDEKIIDKLKGTPPIEWSCTWRYAGGIVAKLRSVHYNVQEDYMDFYCRGNEGVVSELVREKLGQLGWEPLAYDDDYV